MAPREADPALTPTSSMTTHCQGLKLARRGRRRHMALTPAHLLQRSPLKCPSEHQPPPSGCEGEAGRRAVACPGQWYGVSGP